MTVEDKLYTRAVVKTVLLLTAVFQGRSNGEVALEMGWEEREREGSGVQTKDR